MNGYDPIDHHEDRIRDAIRTGLTNPNQQLTIEDVIYEIVDSVEVRALLVDLATLLDVCASEAFHMDATNRARYEAVRYGTVTR